MEKINPTYFRFLKSSLLICLTCLIGFSYAQNKEFEKGIALFKKQNFAEAIDFFKTARQKNEKAYIPIKYLAKSFQEIRDFENSELYYVLTVNSDSVQIEDYLYYSQVLKANGKLLEAKIQFAKYLELSDKYTTGKYQFLGRVFKKLPGDYTEQVLIYLSNKDGLVLDSILTNRFGYFYFENLSNKEDYLIQLKKADSQINLVLENEFGRIYEVINPDREGVYKVSKTIDASLKTTEAKYNSSTSIIARIEHGGEGLKVFKVNIYNNANQIIGTVYTNNRGEFQFNKLEPKSIYFLEFPDLDEKKFEYPQIRLNWLI